MARERPRSRMSTGWRWCRRRANPDARSGKASRRRAAELLPVFVDACIDYLASAASRTATRCSASGTPGSGPATKERQCRPMIAAGQAWCCCSAADDLAAELAARYSELCHQADAATDETEQSGDAKAGADDADAKLLASISGGARRSGQALCGQEARRILPGGNKNSGAALKDAAQALEKSTPTLPMAMAVDERDADRTEDPYARQPPDAGRRTCRGSFPRFSPATRRSPIGDEHQRAAGTGPLDDQPRPSADQPGDGQPPLALAFWRRDWSARPTTSAIWASGPAILSCSIGWRGGLSSRAGRSRRCTG